MVTATLVSTSLQASRSKTAAAILGGSDETHSASCLSPAALLRSRFGSGVAKRDRGKLSEGANSVSTRMKRIAAACNGGVLCVLRVEG